MSWRTHTPGSVLHSTLLWTSCFPLLNGHQKNKQHIKAWKQKRSGKMERLRDALIKTEYYQWVNKVVWFRWDFGWCGIIGWEQDKENQQLCRFMSSYTPDSTWRNLGLITRVALTSSANDLPCSCISCSPHQWDQSELLVRKQKPVAFLSDASWLGNADGQGWNVFLLIKRSRRIRQRHCSAQSIQF